jgi:hypothetical protein
MRTILLGALGIGLVAVAPIGAASASEPVAQPSLTQTYPGESYSQYRRYGPRYGHRGYYRRGYGGGAAAAGVIGGLAAGAIIGGAIANSQAQAAPLPRTQDPDYIAYCSRKYRSFDPVDGTFLATDGNRYPCE